MSDQQIFTEIVAILTPFVKANADAITLESSILKDLQVNSARLVDIVIEIEDKFGIEVKDDDADTIRTVGDAVALVKAKQAAA
ncbi:MAG: acyl carrier protein [Kofleriaceae bacterium]|nr:acyl carrier protein [Kofleriaceae bacterium]MCL4223551.1 acyl carrier protein [Myxococcales bacterium]